MSDKCESLNDLRAEVDRLGKELGEARNRERDLEESRRAMLYMLEDLNESTVNIERAKREWEATFDGISAPVFVHDRKFRILRANKAYERAAGITIREMIGKPYFRVFPKTGSPSCPCISMAETGENEGKEEISTTDPDRVYAVSSYAVRDDEGRYVHAVHVMEDITEKKRDALEKTRLYEKIKESAEVSGSLLEMVETLNTGLDESGLIKNVMNFAPRYMKFERAGIFYYDEILKAFTFAGGYGFTAAEEGLLLSRSFNGSDAPVTEEVLRGETVVVTDASSDGLISREVVDTFHIGCAVIVPISFRGRVAGEIYADYRDVRPIEQKEVCLLRGLANGITIALQNSRLYRESVERLMELSGKIETIKTMARLEREILSTIDRAGILKTATAIINRIIPCERAAVLIREGETCRVVSEWGAGELKDRVYDFTGCSCQLTGAGHGAFFIPDITADACRYHEELSAVGIKSVLFVPLKAEGELHGFLDIGTAHFGRLTPEHLGTAENIASQITVALEKARLYDELEQLLIGTITSLASAIDAKSQWTKGHSERVTGYAVEIAGELGLSQKEIERLKLAGLLHDIGKIGTFDVVLDKPGRLTDEEFEMIKKHPAKGAEILGPIKQIGDIIEVVRYHHERYDGKGYPDGLSGENIPLCARILCVADSYDSMTADRPYRPAPGKEYAISEFKRCSGTQFDPKVVEAFLRLLEGQG